MLAQTTKQMEVDPVNDILFGLTSIPLETYLKCGILDPDSCADPMEVGMSADFFRSLLCRAMEFMKKNQQMIQTLDNEQKFQGMKDRMKDMEKDMAIKKEQASLVVQPDEMSSHYSEFYSLFMDLKIGTKSLVSALSNVDEASKNRELRDDTQTLLRSVGNIFKRVADKVTGIASGFGRLVSDAIEEIGKLIKGGATRIVDLIMQLKERLEGFIRGLIEQMFNFLTWFKDIATKQGFSVSNIEIKLPTIGISNTSVFGLVIPWPDINLPEITVNVNSLNNKQ
jgi:hypothetical protein